MNEFIEKALRRAQEQELSLEESSQLGMRGERNQGRKDNSQKNRKEKKQVR